MSEIGFNKPHSTRTVRMRTSASFPSPIVPEFCLRQPLQLTAGGAVLSMFLGLRRVLVCRTFFGKPPAEIELWSLDDSTGKNECLIREVEMRWFRC